MTKAFARELYNRRVDASDGLCYGRKPSLADDANMTGFTGAAAIVVGSIIFAVIIWVMVFLTEYFFQQTMTTDAAENRADNIALVAFFLILLFPYVRLTWLAFEKQQLPNFSAWKASSGAQKAIANIALAYLLTLGIDDAYTFAIKHHVIDPFPAMSVTTEIETNPQVHKARHDAHAMQIVVSLNNETTFAIWGGLILLFWFTASHLQAMAKRQHINAKVIKKIPFGLWLGESTGRLSNLSHGAGIAPYQQVALFGDDAAQNILVIGATGSGKTTRAINPILLQLIEQGCGGLVFDIKGDFHKTVESLSQKINATHTVIGASQTPFNLLVG